MAARRLGPVTLHRLPTALPPKHRRHDAHRRRGQERLEHAPRPHQSVPERLGPRPVPYGTGPRAGPELRARSLGEMLERNALARTTLQPRLEQPLQSSVQAIERGIDRDRLTEHFQNVRHQLQSVLGRDLWGLGALLGRNRLGSVDSLGQAAS